MQLPRLALLFLALGTYSLKISPKKALRPVHAQKTPTQVKTPVKLDPELIKEAAVAAAGKASAAVGSAATFAAAEMVVAVSGGNVTADDAVEIAVDGATQAAKTVVGTVAANVLASMAKAAATFAAVAAVGPSVKLLTLGGAVALSAENETEAFLKELGDSFQENYARNLAEAKVAKERSARTKYIAKLEEVAASNARAVAHAAAAEQEQAAAARVAELRAWVQDVRQQTAHLESSLRVRRNLLDGSAERIAHGTQRSVTRMSQLAAGAPPDLQLEIDEVLASAEVAQASSMQAIAEALEAKAAAAAKRAEKRRAAKRAKRAEAEALASAEEAASALAEAAAAALASRRPLWRSVLRRPAKLVPVVQPSLWQSHAVATPLTITRARRVVRALYSPLRRAARRVRGA